MKLNEKSVSKSQQRLFGMVDAAKKKGGKAASPKIAKIAKGISKKDAHDFASTKHKGLPERKEKKEKKCSETLNFGKLWNKILHEKRMHLKQQIEVVDDSMFDLHPKYGVPKSQLACRNCGRSFGHCGQVCIQDGCHECRSCHIKKYESSHPDVCKHPKYIDGHKMIEKVINDFRL